MRFALSAERRQFAEALHDLLSTVDVADAAGAWAAGDHGPGLALWRRLAELDVTALAVPHRHGGLDAHPVDLVVACEELGHHAVPGPVAETLAAVPALLSAVADEAVCRRWLPGLADGTLLATLAAPPVLPYAVDAPAAGLILLVDGDDVRLGVPGAARPSLDDARHLSEVTGGPVVAAGPDVAAARARALDLGALACAAQLLGAGRALLEATVGYAGQRTQFGRPIGQFQAVQHRLADVAIGLEFARPLLHAAAIAVAGDTATAARDVSAAKIACGDAAHRAARAALQLHGAIGYTEEYGLGRWLTRIRALLGAWGTPAQHRARVMAALIDERAPSWS